METRILHYFLVLTQVGNITAAADALHVTQPTLSRQFQDLEAEMGTQLFIRGKRSITLTEAGVLFEKRAQAILTYLDQTKTLLTEQTHGLAGELRIGCVESQLSDTVATWLAQFQQAHPHIHFSLVGADGNTIREQIDHDQLDVGFLLEPIESAKYSSQEIPVTETWGLIMAQTAPLAQRSTIVGTDLKDLKLLGPRRQIVKDQIATWLDLEPQTLKFAGDRNLENNVLPLILNHHYYDIGIRGVLNFYPGSPLTFVPFSPLWQTQHTLIWRKNATPSPIATAFIEFVKQSGTKDG